MSADFSRYLLILACGASMATCAGIWWYRPLARPLIGWHLVFIFWWSFVFGHGMGILAGIAPAWPFAIEVLNSASACVVIGWATLAIRLTKLPRPR